MSGKIKFIVLTEHHALHHVLVRRDESAWLQLVASFPSRTRADTFSDIENDMAEDGLAAAEEIDVPPSIPEPRIAIERVVEETRERRVTREISHGHSDGRDSVVTTAADEILSALPGLLLEFPKGPTARVLATRLSIEDHRVRQAVRSLDKDGRALMMRRKDSSSWHLIPPGYDPPIEDLTPTQTNVLTVIVRASDAEGVASLTLGAIADAACIGKGVVVSVLDALENKGRLVVLSRGKGTVPNKYQVIK